MIKKIKILSLLALCFYTFSFVSSRADDEIKSELSCAQKGEGLLFWGSDSSSNVPYVFHNSSNGQIEGFEYDIMQALAKDMGIKPCFIQNAWDGLIPGLSRGSYQVVIDGIEITEPRKSKMLFSNPYLTSVNRIVVPKNTHIQTLLDIKQGRIGTIKSSNAEHLLEDKALNSRTYDEETALFSDLRAGRLTAVLIDEPIAQYYLGNDLEIVGQPIGTVSYGIALDPSSRVLQGQINKALAHIQHNGELGEILYSWKLKDYQHPDESMELRGTPHLDWNAYQSAQEHNRDKSFSALAKRYLSLTPLILYGAWITLLVSFVSMFVAIIVGALVILGRLYGPKWIRALCIGFVEIWRGTPLLIQLLFIFYGLPELGLALPPFLAGVIALGMNYSAYEAENYRNALASISSSQKDAARALNLSRWQTLRWVLVPQAIPRVIPIMTNDFIALLKDSSLVSIITLTDLTQVYVRISSTYYDYLGAGLVIGAVYLIIGMPFVRLAHRLEAKTQEILKIDH